MQSKPSTSPDKSTATSWDSRKSAMTNIKLLGFILLLSGCATLFTGTDDDIRFESEKEFNKASFFNLFNVLFWAVDAVSGSLMKHAPQYYEITLRSNGVVQQSTDVDLYTADTLDSSENGALIIPASSKQTIAIIDGMPGYTLVFERK
jgi:hypothetical protein